MEPTCRARGAPGEPPVSPPAPRQGAGAPPSALPAKPGHVCVTGKQCHTPAARSCGGLVRESSTPEPASAPVLRIRCRRSEAPLRPRASRSCDLATLEPHVQESGRRGDPVRACSALTAARWRRWDACRCIPPCSGSRTPHTRVCACGGLCQCIAHVRTQTRAPRGASSRPSSAPATESLCSTLQTRRFQNVL